MLKIILGLYDFEAETDRLTRNVGH